MRRPSGSLWHHSDFLKLWTGQSISEFGTQVSNLAHPVARGEGAACLAARVLAARRAGVPAVHPLRASRRRLGRPPPPPPDPDRRRREPRRAARVDSDRVGARDPDHVAALRDRRSSPAPSPSSSTSRTSRTCRRSSAGRTWSRGTRSSRLSRSAAQIAGPGLGGVLVGAITAPYAMLVDSVSFAVSALLLGRIRRREPRPEPTCGAEHAGRADGGPALPARRSALAGDHAVRLDVQLLQRSRVLALHRLRGAAPRAVGGRDRTRLRAREPGLAARRRRRPPAQRPARHRLRRSCSQRSSAARPRCSSHSHR